MSYEDKIYHNTKVVRNHFRRLYNLTKESNRDSKSILKEFQHKLKKIANWDDEKIELESNKLDRDFDKVVHDCYLSLARTFYKKPQLFYHRVSDDQKVEHLSEIDYLVKKCLEEHFPEKKVEEESDDEPEPVLDKETYQDDDIKSHVSTAGSLISVKSLKSDKKFGEMDVENEYYEPMDKDDYQGAQGGLKTPFLDEEKDLDSISVKSEPVYGGNDDYERSKRGKPFVLDNLIVRLDKDKHPVVTKVDAETQIESPVEVSVQHNMTDDILETSVDPTQVPLDDDSVIESEDEKEQLEEDDEIEDPDEVIELTGNVIEMEGGERIDLEEEMQGINNEEVKKRNEEKIKKLLDLDIDYETFMEMKENGQLKKMLLVSK